MLKSLRKRFICINMTIIAIMLVVIFGLVFHFTKTNLNQQSDSMLQRLSQSMKIPSNENRDITLPYFVLDINVWGEIKVIGNTHYDLSDAEFIEDLLQKVNAAKVNVGMLNDYKLKYKMQTNPMGTRIVFLDVSGNQQALTALLETSIFIGLLALAIFTFISILLARWAVKPVDLAWKQQKQFVSDASHELKTPLTVIINNAELLQSEECDTESRIQYSENILSGSRQMRDLVNGMLELARADNGQIKNTFCNVDLSQTVAEGTLGFEVLFFEQDLILQSDIEPGICVTGSSQHLRQLIDILLDNAQKYSDKGIVDVQLRKKSKNQCLLTVSNPGTPIPKDELIKIFQRFYRSDTARTSSGSFGLGLSIAKRIAEEHGGQIWADSNETGNRFSVLLPCHHKA